MQLKCEDNGGDYIAHPEGITNLRMKHKLSRWFGAAAVVLGLLAPWNSFSATADPVRKIPVILDSDIGDDIDDTWALGFLLRSPELDLKLVVPDQGKTLYRAKLVAKFLERVGRTEIPIGIGIEKNATGGGAQDEWIKGYSLDSYKGRILTNGVQAIIDTIMNSKERVTLLCIGPVPNIQAALEREPRIAERARFVGMHGSVRFGYGGGKDISAEYNVVADVKACQTVFTAPWDMTITPLDTCGRIMLQGEKFARVRDSKDIIAQTIIENYRAWAKVQKKGDAEQRSSTLFDTVAVYLTFTDALLTMEKLKLVVDDKGFTRIDPQGKTMAVATYWKNLVGFEDLLVQRLTGGK
jgi:inosine-uridine nucleoside N-ribohydrolase